MSKFISNESGNINFVPVIADKFAGKFENQEYLPFILNLFSKYKNILLDDYYPENSPDLVSYLINEINHTYPWFLICIIEGNPVGVIWVSHWHGKEGGKYHSCQIHSCVDKKYRGKITSDALDVFLNFLFNKLGLERIQMEIPEYNHNACAFAKRTGFFQEGIVRCATLKDGMPVNNVLFSKLKGEYNYGKR